VTDTRSPPPPPSLPLAAYLGRWPDGSVNALPPPVAEAAYKKLSPLGVAPLPLPPAPAADAAA
jgi:hypothetical protein